MPRGSRWGELRPAVARGAGPLGILASVLVANLLPILGVVNVSPLVPVGTTGKVVQPGFLPGTPFADLYAGYTSQALGHLAATDWIHGIVPWWNPFEGLGVPLLAEMQSAAFFPPVLLLVLPQGQLWFHVLLEAAAGLSTWFLLRELSFSRAVASVGGILFALNGSFAWLAQSNVNPIAFLPLMLLGVERQYRRASFDPPGFLMLASGAALSIYAGFPETTYYEALLVVAWLLLRVAGPAGQRLILAGRAAMAAGTGVAAAAPVIIAFAAYLPRAFVGRHGSGYYAHIHLSAPSLHILGLPYLLGPLRGYPANSSVANSWTEVGGFVTVGVMLMSFIGFAGGGRDKGLRVLLGATTVVLLLWSFGTPIVQPVLEHLLPGASELEVFRYSVPVWELAMIVAACFGLEQVAARRHPQDQRLLLASGLCAVAALGAVLLLERPTINALTPIGGYEVWLLVTSLAAVVVVVAVTFAALAAGRSDRPRRWPGVAGALVVVEAFAAFLIPQLSAPRSVSFDGGPVTYLADHLGTGRFVSLGVYLPNYGSYFGLASLDVNDVPVPKAWKSYVVTRLMPGVNSVGYELETGRHFGVGTPGLVAYFTHELVANVRAFEAVDTRFVLVPSSMALYGHGPRYVDGVRVAYRDAMTTIYELPAPRPYFSTPGAACTLNWDTRTEVVATCHRPATLIRAELDMPGWSVTVNGTPAPIRQVQGGLEAVSLAAGKSRLAFGYMPPYMDLAIAVMIVGLAAMIGVAILAIALRRRARTNSSAPQADVAPVRSLSSISQA